MPWSFLPRLAVALPMFLILWTFSISPTVAEKTLTPEDSQSTTLRCGDLAAELEAQNQSLKRDIRRIHRELAALRADLEKPGMKEVFSGMGYIVGFFGIASFFASRRGRSKE